MDQHLRIKAFFGTNENAVKTQIWIAISVYLLVAIVKKRLGVAASLYTILQILSLTLFEKTPLDQLLNDIALQNLDSVDSNQLIAGQECELLSFSSIWLLSQALVPTTATGLISRWHA